MRDREPAFAVNRKAIGSASPTELNEIQHPGSATILKQRDFNNGI
jgi:hypothetical protein